MFRNIIYSLFLLASLVSCGSGNGNGSDKKDAAVQAFKAKEYPPMIKIPSVYQEGEQLAEYEAVHFWDSYLDTSALYPTDSTMLNGVIVDGVSKAVENWIGIMETQCSLPVCRKAVTALYDKLEVFSQKDTLCNAFNYFAERMEHFLYDPLSMMRNEDIYLSYIQKVAVSPLLSEDFRPEYEYRVRMCSLNQAGTPAADFVFTDKYGSRHSLYGIKADYTLLFFSNPGCKSCAAVIEYLDNEMIASLVDSGKLAVVCVYIDEVLDEWRKYTSQYPDSWFNGYDQDYKIRTDVSYNVRAIPSLYLLDKQKNVIMKDAPENRICSYLETI